MADTQTAQMETTISQVKPTARPVTAISLLPAPVPGERGDVRHPACGPAFPKTDLDPSGG
jgi:hypothetical protein